MGIVENFTFVCKNGLNFKGRASRREYWLFTLATLIIDIVVAILGFVLGKITGNEFLANAPTYIFSLALLLPSIAVTIRRFHDVGKSGWWMLFCMIGCIAAGIGAIVMLVMMVKKSDGDNQYGPVPGTEGAYGAAAGYGQPYGGAQPGYQASPPQYQQPQYQQPQYQQPQYQAPQQPQYQQPQYPPQGAASAPAFCPNCGSRLEPGAQFCANCGTKIG